MRETQLRAKPRTRNRGSIVAAMILQTQTEMVLRDNWVHCWLDELAMLQIRCRQSEAIKARSKTQRQVMPRGKQEDELKHFMNKTKRKRGISALL